MQTDVETRHGRITVDTRGAGTPLVLLHSGGHDRHDFDAIVARLAARFRTVAIDLPGHGGSAHVDPPGATTTTLVAEAVRDVVTALALPPAVVVGNSVGGLAALSLAMHAPERVRALVLVSPSGLIAQTPMMRAFCWMQGRTFVRRHLGMAFARRYLVRRSAHADAILARMAERRRDERFLAMEAALWRSFGRPESDLAARAGRVRCPTALVWGTRDPVIRSRVEGARARALLPHAEWIALDGLGHVPFAEDPDAFLAAIDPFVTRYAAASDGARAAATGARA